MPPEACHEMMKEMYTWQDIARRTEIVYDQHTSAGGKLRLKEQQQKDQQQKEQQPKEQHEVRPQQEEPVKSTLRKQIKSSGDGLMRDRKEEKEPLYSKSEHRTIENQFTNQNEYGVLIEDLKKCYSCGPFVGKFLVVGYMLDYLYLKIINWIYPISLIDIAPDVS